MGEKIVIGPINRGVRNDRTAFNIDNDAFPVMINFYQWRGRVKRKRGTGKLCRLQRTINIPEIATDADGNFTGNLIALAGLEPTATFPAFLTFNRIIIDGVFITDNNPPNGILSSGDLPLFLGSINYITGDLVIENAPPSSNIEVEYYPGLPVMGLEDLVLPSDDSAFPQNLSFDTVYSYEISTNSPYLAHDVTFYKNPLVDAINLPGYIRKDESTPFKWNGENYQQFWTTNYQSSLWATNGIHIPFDAQNIKMQFASATEITTVTRDPILGTDVEFTIDNCPLIIGDFVFANEFTSVPVINSDSLNFQSGYVIACAPNTPGLATKTLTVRFPFANIPLPGVDESYTPGILQYLTASRFADSDVIRWYDGDPTEGIGLGWVNYMPPLSQFVYSINNLPQRQYYLVGARIVYPFKDRLIFVGPVIQASGVADLPIYLDDTVIYSENGTPYYTCSFDGRITSTTTEFHAILTPVNQTAVAFAMFEDSNAFGGFIAANVGQPINTLSQNEDTLILGFNTMQTRFVYTGNDASPFEFFIVNSELGSTSTFSAINTDTGVISRGSRGFIITSQTNVDRIDLEIIDNQFQISNVNNGTERMCAQRDFINEWIYFTYPFDDFGSIFPSQTLQYNYREGTWALFNESYTTYGTFRKNNGLTWENVGLTYPTWSVWNNPWNFSSYEPLQPIVIAGNQQGFVVERAYGTGEVPSLFIQNFLGGSALSVPNHGLNPNDYIIISGCIGRIGTFVNNKIFQVQIVTDDNTFTVNPSIPVADYLGLGVITRMYVPFMQSRQFPVSWGIARKTRLGVQQYLFTGTERGQITLNIYLSTDDSNPYNDPDINAGDVYSRVLFTCPESTNLGLTPANVSLQMPIARTQAQIWHRISTSLIGDTVQFGFTLSNDQMRTVDENGALISQFAEIEFHGAILDVTASSLLA